jgi:uncharacterized DUF497 family protein
MKISFDPAKRDWTLLERELDFEDAAIVFGSPTLDVVDNRFDYGELRISSMGYLRGRLVNIVWTERGSVRHIISIKKANVRENKRLGPLVPR